MEVSGDTKTSNRLALYRVCQPCSIQRNHVDDIVTLNVGSLSSIEESLSTVNCDNIGDIGSDPRVVQSNFKLEEGVIYDVNAIVESNQAMTTPDHLLAMYDNYSPKVLFYFTHLLTHSVTHSLTHTHTYIHTYIHTYKNKRTFC